MNQLTIELIDIIRSIAHDFVPYDNSHRYRIFDKLRELETSINRPSGSYCIMSLTKEQQEVAMEAIKKLHASSEYSAHNGD